MIIRKYFFIIILLLSILRIDTALPDDITRDQIVFTEVTLKTKEKNTWIINKSKTGGIANKGCIAIANSGIINASDGRLRLETHEATQLHFYTAVSAEELAMKKVTATIAVMASKPVSAELLVRGKNYFKRRKIQISTKSGKYSITERLPKDPNFEVILSLPPDKTTYTIEQVDLTVNDEPKYDNKKNFIINGGAERGWYSTGAITWDYFTTFGRYYTWAGDIISTNPYGRFAIDDKIFHSGKHSFRFDGKNTLRFNPVSYIPGKPCTFTVWMKADKPVSVAMSLLVYSGHAYIKYVMAEKEWKKFTMFIPSWGGEFKGIRKFGDLVTGEGTFFDKAQPQISLNTEGSAKLWFDDASYYLGPQPDTNSDIQEGLILHGHLNKNSQYYKEGENIIASVEMKNRSQTEQTFKLEHYVLNFAGQKKFNEGIGSIKLQPGEVKKLDIPVKCTETGAFNFVFSAININTGKVFDHAFYLGRLGIDSPLTYRLGMSVYPHMNVPGLIPFFKDFRIGSVRLFSRYNAKQNRYTGFDSIYPFKDAKIYTLVNLSFGDKEHWRLGKLNHLLPKDLKPWQNFLRKELPKVKNQVDCYEILNEPNIWPGRTKNPDQNKHSELTPAKYVEVLKAASEVIKSVDPKAKIGGPTPASTNINFICDVLNAGGGKYLDIITQHPYRKTPEMPDYADDLHDLAKAIEITAGKKMPIMGTEIGFMSPNAFYNNIIDDNMRNALSLSVRSMLSGFAAGDTKYFHFQAKFDGFPCGWQSFIAGNPGNNCVPIPNPLMFAMRTIADMIGDAPAIGKINMGSDCRCYIFDCGDHRIVCIWKWTGKEASTDLSSFKNNAILYDMMGNTVPLDKVSLNKFPHYLKTEMDFKTIQDKLTNINIQSDDIVFSENVEIINENNFAIKIKNRSNRTITGYVTATLESSNIQKNNFTIAASKEDKIIFKCQQPINISKQQIVKVRTVVNSPRQEKNSTYELKGMFSRMVQKPLKIDGDLRDWPNNSVITLNHSNACEIKGRVKWNEADKNIKADIMTAWDKQYFYVGVIVHKPDYCPDNNSVATVWNGDSVQIGFDPLKNAGMDQVKYASDDFEYAIGTFKGENIVYRNQASSVNYDGFNKTLGLLSGEVISVVKTEKDKVTYEIAFPQQSLSPFRLEADASMRWNIIININNGKERIGWLQLTPGMGKMPHRPGFFMPIVLLKQ